jgi:hypothetical protein
MNTLKLFFALLFLAAHTVARADNFGPITIVDSRPINEVWLNAGFYSYHFERDLNLDDNNLGIGAEYRFSNVSALTIGGFHNSDLQISRYAALLWQPIEIAGVRLGVLLGTINGYPMAFNGQFFPIILPVASFEYKFVGFNLTVVPTIPNLLHGSISLQMKLKVF